ncbi:unnamed protein product [Acidithrix sp. C25]|nr:UDP-glucuronic acid decarboxylase family protein [Acidithrix sp. C25]CAG4910015.1 unnamed protein product [Acidithrix sp. C25]
MRNLVTGGAGFIGSHLCDLLIAQGESVICLDNFSTGRMENIEHLIDHPHFELLEWDVETPYEVEVGRIYNMACPASPPHYQSNPIKTTKTSVFGALNALELATRTGARVLQASTSEVYGDPLEHPQTESYWGHVNPIGIRSCYDEGKRVAESLFFDYHRTHGTDIRVVRIFNTYGPRMREDDGRVVSNLLSQAARELPLSVYGSGQQTRSFCYVSDLVRGIYGVMDASRVPGPFNVGNPIERTILEMVEYAKKLSGKDLSTTYMDLPLDDPRKRKPDISLISKEISWEPVVSLEDGLALTYEYFAGRV